MRKIAVGVSVFVLSILMTSSPYAQDKERKRQDPPPPPPERERAVPREHPRAEPQRQQPPPERAKPRRKEPPPERAEPRREPPPPPQRGEEGQDRGRAEPRRREPPPPSRGDQERPRAEPRRPSPRPNQGYTVPRRLPNDSDLRERAVPREQPLPRPRPGYGAYNQGYRNGHRYFWRVVPYHYRSYNMCVWGHWEWDLWSQCWVWVEGYCNVHNHYHPRFSGFYFWFEFRR